MLHKKTPDDEALFRFTSQYEAAPFHSAMKHFRFRSNMKHSACAAYNEKMKNESILHMKPVNASQNCRTSRVSMDDLSELKAIEKMPFCGILNQVELTERKEIPAYAGGVEK